jgi:hypothetical protein
MALSLVGRHLPCAICRCLSIHAGAAGTARRLRDRGYRDTEDGVCFLIDIFAGAEIAIAWTSTSIGRNKKSSNQKSLKGET